MVHAVLRWAESEFREIHLKRQSCVSRVSENLFRISVRVKPNSRISRILGFSPERGVLEIELKAQPRDGEANAELIDVLSDFFRIPKRSFSLAAGSQSREKVIEVRAENSSEIDKTLMVLQAQDASSAKEERPVRYTKSNLPSKICAACGRPFNWRKKWERCWDEVRYCSERCRSEKGLART